MERHFLAANGCLLAEKTAVCVPASPDCVSLETALGDLGHPDPSPASLVGPGSVGKCGRCHLTAGAGVGILLKTPRSAPVPPFPALRPFATSFYPAPTPEGRKDPRHYIEDASSDVRGRTHPIRCPGNLLPWAFPHPAHATSPTAPRRRHLVALSQFPPELLHQARHREPVLGSMLLACPLPGTSWVAPKSIPPPTRSL